MKKVTVGYHKVIAGEDCYYPGSGGYYKNTATMVFGDERAFCYIPVGMHRAYSRRIMVRILSQLGVRYPVEVAEMAVDSLQGQDFTVWAAGLPHAEGLCFHVDRQLHIDNFRLLMRYNGITLDCRIPTDGSDRVLPGYLHVQSGMARLWTTDAPTDGTESVAHWYDRMRIDDLDQCVTGERITIRCRLDRKYQQAFTLTGTDAARHLSLVRLNPFDRTAAVAGLRSLLDKFDHIDASLV